MAFREFAKLRELGLLVGFLLIILVAGQICFSTDSEVLLSFFGGADQVAGSCYLLQTQEDQVLIDCGSLMPGSADDSPIASTSAMSDEGAFEFSPNDVDALLLTHAHLDHTGRIHYLVQKGFEGPIYMTQATADIFLARLNDDVYYSEVPQEEQQRLIEDIHEQLRLVSYGERISVTEAIKCVFVDAGHLPGSASIVVTITSGLEKATMTFSGDIGSGLHPFLNLPDLEMLSRTDTQVLQIESTYGYAAPREPSETGYEKLWDTLREAKETGCLVIIPAFALDRTQRVLGAIEEGIRQGSLRSDTRVLVGGKSSCYFTNLYKAFASNKGQYAQYFSDAFWDNAMLTQLEWTYARGENCSGFDPHPAINKNYYRQFDIVIAPSGTGDSSLSKSLLKAFADDPDVVVVKVGWAPPSSPMGQLAAGAEVIFFDDDGTRLEVVPHVRESFLDVGKSFSGHADIAMLLEYIEAFSDLESVIIVHGDDSFGARAGLRAAIFDRFPELNVLLPFYGQTIDPFNLERYRCWETICPSANCIPADDAQDHVGHTLWVCGTVASARRIEDGRTFINLEQAYPEQKFTIMIDPRHISDFDAAFGGRFYERLIGTTICVYGQVVLYEGVPEIIPTTPEAIRSSALGLSLPEPCQCGD